MPSVGFGTDSQKYCSKHLFSFGLNMQIWVPFLLYSTGYLLQASLELPLAFSHKISSLHFEYSLALFSIQTVSVGFEVGKSEQDFSPSSVTSLHDFNYSSHLFVSELKEQK